MKILIQKKACIFLLCLLVTILSKAQEITIGNTGVHMELHKNCNILPKPNTKHTIIRKLNLPSFEKGMYYRPYRDVVAAGNQVDAIAFESIKALQAYRPSVTRKDRSSILDGQYILLKIKEGKYLSLLPMVSTLAYAQFYIEKKELILKAGNYGTAKLMGDVPLLIWAYGESPYEATHNSWKMAIASGYISTDWRMNKKFPEMYKYIGWCSWEHYKKRISEDIITRAVHTLEDNKAPFRWLLVDDGYLTANKGRSIISYKPDKQKFPNGWKAVTDLKTPDKIKWMGVWRNMLGYMTAVAPNHRIKEYKGQLIANNHYMLPNGTKDGAKLFYETMIADSKKNGFDFTKVDFQSKAFHLYYGTKNPVLSMRNNNEALENACIKYDIPLLNCIAQPNINAMQTKYSALTRSSTDYHKTNKNKNKCSTYQSFANHLWMGQTVWCDMDMFHSHDERDVQPMSIARAISGGPVYVSDDPSLIVAEKLLPFCDIDGKVFRAKAPATLLPESFFIHPFKDKNVFRVVAPLENDVAAIALFNFTESKRTLSSFISVKDYTYAGELLQPYAGAWDIPKEDLLVYDRDENKVVSLKEKLTYDIPDFRAKMLLLYPKKEGWAVIGRADKYLPAATVKVTAISDKKVTLILKESGPLTVWSDKGTPKMEGASFRSLGDGLYVADLKIEKGERKIELTR